MSLKSPELIEINLQNLKFKKIKEKTDVTNFLITDFENKKKSIILENVIIPFGVETYEKKNILNIEIEPKKNNSHYNYYAVISNFESELTKPENIKYEKLSREVTNKGYYPNIRESKGGYIIRSHVFTTPEVFTMVSGRDKTIKNLKDKRTMLDIVRTRANIELELGTVWVNDNNYGFLWYVKRIEILSAL
jgi:hypothetical protein